ncbi:MAG: two component transcriptional regulator, Fis family [Myxococcales bacterium]|nr:two component transcriptional regulator, Fis family [Myxococcales bacterium]
MMSTTSRVVLLVGQDSSVRDALTDAVRRRGWSARAAQNCAEAVRAASVGAPDFLVVEQHLGDGSGLDLVRRLRALNLELRAVMVSRTPSIAAAVLAIREGFLDYRATPIDGDRLLGAFDGGPDLPLDPSSPAAPESLGKQASLEHVEWTHIQAVLSDVGGNVSRAARVLGLHRRSLQRRLQRTRLPAQPPF